MAKPFLKWAGGKRRLLTQYSTLFPRQFSCYFEPFLGGGAVFFYLEPEIAVLYDINAELVNAYIAVRDHVDDVIERLRAMPYDRDFYYRTRAQQPDALSQIERATRTIYLNRTCFNGLYRVNKKGQFNVPFGRYKNPRICDEPTLRAASAVLQGKRIHTADFATVVNEARAEDFVYFDPPYYPRNEQNGFTGYTADGFNAEEQRRLADTFRALDQMGCYVMLSSSNSEMIRDLYEGFNITEVTSNYPINCRKSGRGPVKEIVIRNYN